jgi:hypothetical protein
MEVKKLGVRTPIHHPSYIIHHKLLYSTFASVSRSYIP